MVRIPGLHCPGEGSVPDQRTEILQTQCGPKTGRKKKRKNVQKSVWLVWERISDGGNAGREPYCIVVQLQVLDSSGSCANRSSSTFFFLIFY